MRQAAYLGLCGFICLFFIARDLWISPDPASLPRDAFFAVCIGLGLVSWLANRFLYFKSAAMLAGAVASAIKGVHRSTDGRNAIAILYAILFLFFIGELIDAIVGIVKQKRAAPGPLREADQSSKI